MTLCNRLGGGLALGTLPSAAVTLCMPLPDWGCTGTMKIKPVRACDGAFHTVSFLLHPINAIL